MPLARLAGYDARNSFGLGPFGDLITDGQDQNRNTAGSFNSQWGVVTPLQAMKIEAVLWDIRNAGTYTMSVNGIDIATQVVSSGPAADVEFAFTAPWLLGLCGYMFKLTKSDAAVTWSDKNATSYASAYWSNDAIGYNTTDYTAYTLPIKLKFRLRGALVEVV